MMTEETINNNDTTTAGTAPGKTAGTRSIAIFTEFDEALLRRDYVDKQPFVLRGVASDWPVSGKWDYDWIRKQCGDTTIRPYCFNRKSKSQSYLFQAVFNRTKMTIEKFFAEKFQKGGSLWSIKECHEVFEAHPELKEDFQFEDVYMGPTDIPRAHYFWIGNADSSIGLHADMVIYSCMLQIHGRKHWKFYPPADKEYLYMETKGAIDGGMYSPLDVFSTVDLTEYPLFAKATEFNLILQPGDILYVPNGWWHAVYSMDATMSVNYVAERCNNISTGFLSAWWINDYLEGSRLLLLYLLRQMLTFITYILPVGSSSNKNKKTETLLDNDTGAVWTPKSDEMEAKGK